MASLRIIDLEGKSKGSFELDPKVFDGKVHQPAIYETIVSYLSNRRQGNASTKTRGEVRGGGRKPWRQKGTGRARVGSIRTPLWRGGGVVFGPHTRDYHYWIPRKIRRLALKSCLNSKLNEKQLILVEDIKLSDYKTKDISNLLKKLKIDKSCLLVTGLDNQGIFKASRNISYLKVANYQTVNAYDILRFKRLLLTKTALEALNKRLK